MLPAKTPSGPGMDQLIYEHTASPEVSQLEFHMTVRG